MIAISLNSWVKRADATILCVAERETTEIELKSSVLDNSYITIPNYYSSAAVRSRVFESTGGNE